MACCPQLDKSRKQPAFSTIVSNVSLLSKFQVLFCQDVQSWIELANKINGVNFWQVHGTRYNLSSVGNLNILGFGTVDIEHINMEINFCLLISSSLSCVLYVCDWYCLVVNHPWLAWKNKIASLSYSLKKIRTKIYWLNFSNISHFTWLQKSLCKWLSDKT